MINEKREWKRGKIRTENNLYSTKRHKQSFVSTIQFDDVNKLNLFASVFVRCMVPCIDARRNNKIKSSHKKMRRNGILVKKFHCSLGRQAISISNILVIMNLQRWVNTAAKNYSHTHPHTDMHIHGTQCLGQVSLSAWIAIFRVFIYSFINWTCQQTLCCMYIVQIVFIHRHFIFIRRCACIFAVAV